MKTLTQISELNKKFEKQFNYKIDGAQQGSEVWFNTKLGVLSASCASDIVAGTKTATRLTYMAELVAQIATGQRAEVNAKAMDWGKQHESASRAYYELKTGKTLTEMSFVFKDDKWRIGCSPDTLVNDIKGNEIKCPFNSTNYVKFLCEDKFSLDWERQCQFGMWVLEADLWDFSMYDPRMLKKPMKTVPIERDEAMIKTFEDAVPQFIHDMDLMLKKCGFEFGEQWARLAERPPAASPTP